MNGVYTHPALFSWKPSCVYTRSINELQISLSLNPLLAWGQLRDDQDQTCTSSRPAPLFLKTSPTPISGPVKLSQDQPSSSYRPVIFLQTAKLFLRNNFRYTVVIVLHNDLLYKAACWMCRLWVVVIYSCCSSNGFTHCSCTNWQLLQVDSSFTPTH